MEQSKTRLQDVARWLKGAAILAERADRLYADATPKGMQPADVHRMARGDVADAVKMAEYAVKQLQEAAEGFCCVPADLGL